MIPLLSAGFINLERKRIFCNVEYGSGSGAALILPALALVWWSKKQSGWLSPNESLSLITLSIVALLTFLVASLRQSDRLAQKGCDG